MLKITELRKGNILAFVLPNKICVIDYIDDLVGSSPIERQSDFNAERGIEDFNPVELSQEWLIRFGFERVYYKDKPVWINKKLDPMFLNCSYHVVVKEGGFVAFMVFDCFLKHIKYVHQFQNLCFALTDCELTFTE
jgi:hypothetical protein